MRDLGQVPDTHPKWIMLDGALEEFGRYGVVGGGPTGR